MPACNPFYFEDEVVASATRSANGDSGPLESYGAFDQLVLQGIVTACTGSGTLSLLVEDSLDGGTTWSTVDSVTNGVSGPVVYSRRITVPFGRLLRVRWVIGGLTDVTFSVNLAAKA